MKSTDQKIESQADDLSVENVYTAQGYATLIAYIGGIELRLCHPQRTPFAWVHFHTRNKTTF